jgi:RNA polymerase sigma factor (sigma-70 family)
MACGNWGMDRQKVSTQVLLDRARYGARTAIGHIIGLYEPLIEAAVRRHLGPKRFQEEGDDLLQAIRLTLVKGLRTFRGTNRAVLVAWMRRTIENQILDWEKGRRAQCRVPVGGALERISHDGPPVADSAPRPSQILLRREQVERLRRAIETAPERYRGILRFLYEKSPTRAEVAAFTRKNPEAAGKVIARALAYLRTTLRERG